MPSTWVSPRVWVAGERVTATKMNEISTDFNALYPFTTAGDIAYRDGSGDYLARLGVGSAWQLLRSTGTAPAYASLATIAQNTALVSGQVQGAIFAASGASALVTIANSISNTFLSGGSNYPQYGSVLYARKGGSASSWATGGTSGYTPSSSLFQGGASNVTVTTGSGSASISFGTAYATSNAPIVMVGLYCTDSRRLTHRITSVTNIGFDITVNDIDSLSTTVTVFWLSIGE